MSSIEKTAYPRLKSNPTAQALADLYTPSPDELALAQRVTRGPSNQLSFLIQLKTFQRVGYAVPVTEVPASIVRHIATTTQDSTSTSDLFAYQGSRSQFRHLEVIRAYLKIQPFGQAARQVINQAMEAAAPTKHDLADLINVAVEELVRQRYELPAFSTLLKAARQVRNTTITGFYQQVSKSLRSSETVQINRLFVTDPKTRKTQWEQLKQEPGKPVLSRLKAWTERLQWLSTLQWGEAALASIPAVKVSHFAAEAQTLDVSRMKELESPKRYTLAVALLSVQYTRTLDDIAELFIKRFRQLHHQAKEALAQYRIDHQNQTDELVGTLRELVLAYQSEGNLSQRFKAIKEVIGEHSQSIIEDCDAHLAYVGNNYFSFLPQFYRSHRATLMRMLDVLPLRSSTQDESLIQALQFIREHSEKRRTWLSIVQDSPKKDAQQQSIQTLDISWIPAQWWPLVTSQRQHQPKPTKVHRIYFEICVFSHLLLELQSGDIYIEGSQEYGDYYAQLISWEEYKAAVNDYGQLVNLPVEPKAFVNHVRQRLKTVANKVDSAFPENTQVSYQDNQLVIHKRKRKAVEGLAALKELIAERIRPTHIMNVLSDTETWLNWTRFFGPISGYDAKLDDPVARYLVTIFCYGCNLAPSQTARSLDEFDRRQIWWTHNRHVQEETLQEAIVSIINSYNRFTLPRFWGSTKRAAVDGTKWDIYEDNLLAEYHIRYGGYGGIGYYHISDTYIALFSRFIPCGVWESVHLLDGLVHNTSDIEPDTIHGDTQAQSVTVFGLAFLLGIKLMPRIRRWKDLIFYRPSRSDRYKHLDSLFTETIDWELIENYLPDMLRVALSIKAGKIQASTILRKLGTKSRKNKLYQAFHELGSAIRTIFLLDYLSDEELRATIQAAINKCESFNRFTKWLAFGGENIIATNHRDEQHKRIKYNHLVANCLIFYNVSELNRILNELHQEGYRFSQELIALLSPYPTDHVNRFGIYQLERPREPMPLDFRIPDWAKEMQESSD